MLVTITCNFATLSPVWIGVGHKEANRQISTGSQEEGEMGRVGGGRGSSWGRVMGGWGGVGICKWKVINFANLPNLSLLHRRGGKHWNGEKKRRNQNKEPTQTNCWDLWLDTPQHARTHTHTHAGTSTHKHTLLFRSVFRPFLVTHWQEQTLRQHVIVFTLDLTRAACKFTEVVGPASPSPPHPFFSPPALVNVNAVCFVQGSREYGRRCVH